MNDDTCKCGKRSLRSWWEAVTDAGDEGTDRIRHSRTACLTETERRAQRAAQTPHVRKVMTDSDLVVACKNIGFDLTCGACAGQFYTGSQLGEHTCPSGGRTETQRADGAEAALSLQTERAIRAEAQCKRLLATVQSLLEAIQTATVGDLTDSDRVSRYRACLLCRRDINVCERDYRVAVETNALDRACKGAKVRATYWRALQDVFWGGEQREIHKSIGKEVLPLDVPLSPAAKAQLEAGLASARRGEISEWKRSDLKLPPGACHNCGGEGQVVQHHGPDDNYDGVVCVTCDGSGLAHSPVQEMVREFHAAFLPEQTRDAVGIPSDDLVRLRVKLPFEEAFELLRASFAPTHKNDADELWVHVRRLIRTAKVQVNLIEVADAFADLAYVVEGGNLAYGIDSRSVLAEVHRSNMSKIGGHRDENGKWIKPPTYSKADVAMVLKKQGWQS
jgi:predicted HAD superfamily Cof-like phosphohydrolase